MDKRKITFPRTPIIDCESEISILLENVLLNYFYSFTIKFPTPPLILRSVIVTLVKDDRKVSFEAPPVDGVHVVGGALVHPGVHLCGRIDFNLGLDLVLPNAPLVGLTGIEKYP